MFSPAHRGIVLVSVFCGACFDMGYVRAPVAVDKLYVGEESPALTLLRSEKGPHRFARVTKGVYRGGHPSKEQMQALKELGVRTIISLQREDGDLRQQEQSEATELGMRFVSFPFYGVFGADEEFLRSIVTTMKSGDVYIHCKRGRDRTSVMVALYRVMVQGWEPKVAWKLEVLDYGYQPTEFYQALGRAYDKMVRTYVKPGAPPVHKPSYPTGKQDQLASKTESPQTERIKKDRRIVEGDLESISF